MADEKILNIILESIKELKTDVKAEISELKADMNSRFDKILGITDDLVKKKDCTESRDGCTKMTELEVVKSEWSYKKIVAIGGVITATLTASTVAITTILKAMYG